jgi:hypothetical protein
MYLTTYLRDRNRLSGDTLSQALPLIPAASMDVANRFLTWLGV